MPIDEVAGSLLGGLARFVGWMVVDLFFEVIIKGVGYRVLIVLRPTREPSETACTVVGLLCWLAVLGIVFGTYQLIRA